MGDLVLFIPGRLKNPTNRHNGITGHWAATHRWARGWKDATAAMVLVADGRHGRFRQLRAAVAQGATLEVTFTGRVPRRFDSDGYVAACKPVRDQLAELLGTHDGPGAGHVWTYAPQVVERDPSHHGVGVVVRLATGGAA